MKPLKLVTWNVKGIGHPIKRTKILTALKKEKVEIALLQETYLTPKEHLKLQKDWVGQIFFSSFKTNSRGVAILIHKHTPFELIEQISDTEGRYILVKGKIWDKELTLLNIYAPNTDTPSFISDMISLFNIHCTTLGLMGGTTT